MGSIDNRIVQMQFDNKQFESGIQTSIKSLDGLKRGLDLEGATKGLSNLDNISKTFSLKHLTDGVDLIASKFTTLGIIGVTALQNITNSAINTGTQLIRSLTVDPVKMGFDEYETKMNAIQTILTNTASKGTTMNDVTAALEELNKYADQTIYDFSEMTRNIGTFTAAGVDLKTSTTSIKGIANLAAGSGSSAMQASTAMYQLSQAIAAGSVKLQDWNSVVNAGMGGELFQKALEQTAKELGHGRDMSVSFRESLESGWITTKVLTQTLEKFANDKSLIQAATQVKTFTQLMDTMKESVQSGWAQTWETIIGNRDEAAKLFTSINDTFGAMIGKSAEARNSMLEFWKANGGRDALIQGITNAFKGLQSILKPINEAFREIFPAMTGQRLVELSKAFNDLTSKFKIGEQTTANIKNTFKGLFAVLDIGKQALTAIGKGIADLIGYYLPAGNGLLSLTGSVGNFLVSLDETVKKSGVFTVAIGKISDVIKYVTSEISSAANRIKTSLEPFAVIGDIIQKAFSKIGDTIKKISPVFYKFTEVMSKTFANMIDNMAKALDNGGSSSLLDLINAGLFAGILLGLKNFIGSMAKITSNASGFLKSITGILDGVKGSLQAYQSSLKANTLIKIATAIGILAASLLILATINQDRLKSSMAAMTGMFIELFGSMSVFEKIVGGSGFKSMARITTSMILLSLSVLILSSAMSKLAELNWEGIKKGLAGVAALSAILVKAANGISSGAKGLIRASIGLVIFAGAINILSIAVDKLSGIDVTALAKGLIGVGVLIKQLSIFMNTTNFNKMGISTGLGILTLSGALLILTSAVKKLSDIGMGSLIKGLAGVGAMLLEISLFVNSTINVKKVISTSIGLTILGAAMLIFASAIEKMGSLSIEQLAKGLISMGVALNIIASALTFMPQNIAVRAIGLVAIAEAMVILSSALSKMGGMSWEEIAKGLITLAGALTIMTIAMIFAQTGLGGAAAILVMAGALAILTPPLVTLSKLSLDEIGNGLRAMAGAFAVLGIAGLLLAPLVPTLLGLSISMTLFGVSALAIGAGLLLFGLGLSALATGGTAAAAALVVVMTSIVSVIPMLQTIIDGIINIAIGIGNQAPVIGAAFLNVLLAIINAINSAAPQIMTCIVGLITSMLNALVAAVPQMVYSGMQLVIGILNGVAANIGQVVASGINVILQFINGVISKLPAIIDAAFRVIISFINGLASAINNNHGAIYAAVANLIGAIVQAAIDLGPTLVGVGENIIRGMIRGIVSMAGSLVRAAEGVISEAVQGAKNLLGIHSPSRVFAEIGKFSALGFAVGLKDFSGSVVTAAKDIGVGTIATLKDTMSTVSDIVSGNVNMDPTIKPVLDLSNVTDGAGTINSLLNKTQGITVSTANGKASLISSSMNSVNDSVQNGSSNQNTTPTTSSPNVSNSKPMTLQLVLQNGKAIAEYIVNDIDAIQGKNTRINARGYGL